MKKHEINNEKDKSKGIVLSRENEIKARNFRKNNVAV